MPTRKTEKKSSPVAKKTTVKAKNTPKKESTSRVSAPSKSTRMTVGDLQKKVMDPKNRRSLLLAIALIALVIILYLARGLFVAATVNGEPISRISVIHDLEQQSGQMVLDSMVTKTLVLQEADKKNIKVSDKEIDDEIAKIQKQFSSQGQNLDQLLAAQGLTKDSFRDEVKIQLLVTKILGDQVKVTDKEFNDFLAKNQDLIKDEKDQAAAKANLRTQMEQQKLSQKYQEWIANVKKNAKIQYFVNY